MNKKKSLIRSLIIITAVSFMAGIQIGTAKESGKSQLGLGGGGLYKASGSPRATLVNINQMSVWTRADGFSSRNPMTGNSGVVYPRGTAGVIFADGILWGGLVKDGQSPELRAGGATYISGTLEGAIVSKGVQESVSAADVRIWRIREDWETADLRQDASEFFDVSLNSVSDGQIATVRAQYGTDWNEWPWQKGAPYYDDVADGVYNPADDRPGIAGADQVVWFVRNDLSAGATTGFLGSPPVGMEIQEALWGYARTDALGNMIFKKVQLIYKGTSDTPDGSGALPAATIEELFLTQWSDPDLGDFGDDFAGSVPSLSLGYAYNSSSVDVAFRDFGLPPPAVGYDFFQGPIVDAPGETAIFDLKIVQDKKNLPMSSFVFFAAGSAISDPPLGAYEGTTQWYNLMHGLQPATGNPFIDPNTGIATVFTLSGDPKTGEGWVDGNPLGPGDRRFLLTAGPFTMAFGDTQELVISLIAGLGGDRISSIDVLKFYDITAQNAFDNLFDLPTPPQAPKANAIALDQAIVLEWGSDLAAVNVTEGQDNKGYKFEGYNVYELPTVTATLADAVKLITFDEINEITTILDPTFEPISGQILNLPSQIGKNSGISRSFTITTNSDGDELVNYREYYFAVTAYNNNSSVNAPVHALESAPVILTVIPQPASPGARYDTTPIGDLLDVAHSAGTSDGSVSPIVVDPGQFTGDEYSVTFNADLTWNLLRAGSLVSGLDSLTNQSGDGKYPIIDGVQVKVEGPPLQAKSFAYVGGAGTGARWFSGCSHGGEILFGGVFLDFTFWGASATAPADYKAVEIRFGGMSSFVDGSGTLGEVNGTYDFGEDYTVDTSKPNQGAFMYKTWGAGNYTGFNPVPFEAWDVDDAANPRQLNIFMRDWSANAGDYGVGQWDLSFVGAGVPFEYTWIMATDYDATGTIYNPNSTGADLMDVLAGSGPGEVNAYYTLWLCPRGSAAFLSDDGVLTLEPNRVNAGPDVFTFTPQAPAVTAENKDEDFNSINVFPNPYMGVNSLETTRVARWVRFTHLPQEATIRIFNLAGIHVATVSKDDNLQYTDWDLNNWNDLPVASGVYLAHVTLADGFEKTLKLMIVQEQQFLQNF